MVALDKTAPNTAMLPRGSRVCTRTAALRGAALRSTARRYASATPAAAARRALPTACTAPPARLRLRLWPVAGGAAAAVLAAGAGASRCDSEELPEDGRQMNAETTEKKKTKSKPKKKKKKGEAAPDDEAETKKKAAEEKKEAEKKKKDEEKKKKEEEKKAKDEADKKAKAAKAVATPRVEPALELRHLQRMIFLNGSISDSMAKNVIADLLYLDALEDNSEEPGSPRPIQLVINSGGGIVTSGLAIYDVMQFIRSPVHTLCIGHASSMAAILLAAGEPEHRQIMPHARVMIHSASGGYGRSKVEDVLVHAEELKAKNDLLATILARHLGVTVERVQELWRIDNYMTPEQALELGIVDDICTKREPIIDPAAAAAKAAAAAADAK